MPGSPVAAEREGHSEGLTSHLGDPHSPPSAFLRLRRWVEKRGGAGHLSLYRDGGLKRTSVPGGTQWRATGTHILEDFKLQGRGVQVVELPCNGGAGVRQRAHRFPPRV